MNGFRPLPLTLACLAAAVLGLGLIPQPAGAFPPAPYYTLYGMVRDQVGQALEVEGAELILLKGGVEAGRAPINSQLQVDQNYEINIRLDANRASTQPYVSSAIAASGPFSLAVEMNGARFYPIEVTGDLTAGKGGERVRLDLNLGEDTDGDGLPDIWEQWQLYQAGILPDGTGWNLALISRNGDFDGDGASNWLEYVAGTFAGDITERFGLTIKERAPAWLRFEFFSITGKVYTIERSTDMAVWTRVPFGPGPEGARADHLRATEVGIMSAYTAAAADPREFYRLTVR